MPRQRRSCKLTASQGDAHASAQIWAKTLPGPLVSSLSTRSLERVGLSATSCGFSIARLCLSRATQHGEVCRGEPVEFQTMKGTCRRRVCAQRAMAAMPRSSVHDDNRPLPRQPIVQSTWLDFRRVLRRTCRQPRN